MKNTINITGEEKSFIYLIDYSTNNEYKESDNIGWHNCDLNKDTVHLFNNSIDHFRHGNNWYSTTTMSLNSEYIPDNIKYSKLKIYIPNYNVSIYKRGIKYALTVNTWINGVKIDLGSFVFKPTETIACPEGLIKRGINEYCEYIEFDIIDPFEVAYADDWIDFRHNVCNEPLQQNSTESMLYVSLYIIDEYEERYMINSEYNGGITCFNIADSYDELALDLSQEYDPLGLTLTLDYNYVYDWFLSYLYETYNINAAHRDIEFELVIKNKDSIIIGPRIGYNMDEYNSRGIQFISYNTIMKDSNMSLFFSDWNNYEDGWNFVVSLIVNDPGKITEDKTIEHNVDGLNYIQYVTRRTDDDVELFNTVSNEIPITQEIFSRYISGSDKIIDIKDMQINTYNVVNKIENKIFQIERPNESKSNLIQPVFFKVKDTETLTLHPEVTENICINLDDYKSKVNRFILQIDNCKYDQIGANKYGILFKIVGKTLSEELVSGTYYILNENYELVTTGKYNCIR